MRPVLSTMRLAAVLGLLSGCEGVDVPSPLPRTDRAGRDDAYTRAPLRPGTLVLPTGARIRVRLGEMLDSDRTHEGHRFTTTVVDDVTSGRGVVVIPRGSLIYGYVASVQHIVNRTSMRLRFDVDDLPEGRRITLDAEPPQDSKLDLDELGEKGVQEAGKFVVQQGLTAATGGLLAPVWMVMRAQKLYGFVTKDACMIFPRNSIMTIELTRPAYIPPPGRK